MQPSLIACDRNAWASEAGALARARRAVWTQTGGGRKRQRRSALRSRLRGRLFLLPLTGRANGIRRRRALEGLCLEPDVQAAAVDLSDIARPPPPPPSRKLIFFTYIV